MKTNAERSCVLAAMKRSGAPLTRDEFLSWFYMGDVPEMIHPEDEYEFPEQFQLDTLNGPIATDKIQ